LNFPNSKYWTTLNNKFNHQLVENIKQYFDTQEVFSLRSIDLIIDDNYLLSEADELLNQLFTDKYLDCEIIYVCPQCDDELNEEELDDKGCQKCGYSLEHEEPTKTKVYSFQGGIRKRDISWFFIIHGMNTRGAWQEDFSWKIEKIYGYSIPVAIYKYGKIISTPFLKPFWKKFINKTLAKIKTLNDEIIIDRETQHRPDVVAHSFGTLLISELLKKYPELKLGRVILTGSIISPDFNWELIFQRGQVEAVLCHCAGKDFWSRVSHYWIYNSGPSGVIGFNQKELIHHTFEPTFRHSDFFKENFDKNINETWAPFLTDQLQPIDSNKQLQPKNKKLWQPSKLRFISFPLKYIIIALLVFSIIFLLISLPMGIIKTYNLFFTQ